MERVTFLDIETDGLPGKNLHWDRYYDSFPHIVEIAWKTGCRQHSFILNQEGRTIPQEATDINGITNQMAEGSPYTFRHVIGLLIKDAEQSEILVGHNFYFDSSVIKANIIREFGRDSDHVRRAIAALDKSKRRDTLRMAMKLKMGFCSLTTLHEKLFGNSYNAHHAVDDIQATERCYNELLNLTPK